MIVFLSQWEMGGLYLRGAQVAQFLTLIGMAVGTGLAICDLSLPLQVSGVMYFALALFVWLGFPETRFTPTDSREETLGGPCGGRFSLG